MNIYLETCDGGILPIFLHRAARQIHHIVIFSATCPAEVQAGSHHAVKAIVGVVFVLLDVSHDINQGSAMEEPLEIGVLYSRGHHLIQTRVAEVLTVYTLRGPPKLEIEV